MTVLLSPIAVQRISLKVQIAIYELNFMGKAARYPDIYKKIPTENPDNIGRVIREFKNRSGYWKTWGKGLFYYPETRFEKEFILKNFGEKI